jgi:hypothetical protein
MKKVTPDYILSFTDGEGCFTLHIVKRAKSPFGVFFTPSFSLSQNTSSLAVLQEIQVFFGCGFLRKDRKTSKYEIRDLGNLEQKIVPFFQKYTLKTQKNEDFKVFCEICSLLREKHHYTSQGISHLIDLAYSMNQNGVFRRKKKQTTQ